MTKWQNALKTFDTVKIDQSGVLVDAVVIHAGEGGLSVVYPSDVRNASGGVDWLDQCTIHRVPWTQVQGPKAVPGRLYSIVTGVCPVRRSVYVGLTDGRVARVEIIKRLAFDPNQMEDYE